MSVVKKIKDGAGTEYDVGVDASNVSGTLPIANGGTGATTSKEAQYKLLGDMNSVTSDIGDQTQFAGAYITPSTTNGALYKNTFAKVWAYIRTKLGIGSQVGNTTNPVYVSSSGVVTACGGTLGVSITGTAYNSRFAYTTYTEGQNLVDLCVMGVNQRGWTKDTTITDRYVLYKTLSRDEVISPAYKYWKPCKLRIRYSIYTTLSRDSNAAYLGTDFGIYFRKNDPATATTIKYLGKRVYGSDSPEWVDVDEIVTLNYSTYDCYYFFFQSQDTSGNSGSTRSGVVKIKDIRVERIPDYAGTATTATDYSATGGIATALAGKQATLTQGTNITISGTTISATDTTYSEPDDDTLQSIVDSLS